MYGKKVLEEMKQEEREELEKTYTGTTSSLERSLALRYIEKETKEDPSLIKPIAT